MLDLDHLREYNSRFGHLMGSRVLATVGHTLHKALRERDFVAKYGGDEFIVILRGSSKAGAVDVALRLKDLISHRTFFGVPQGHITCSFGVATFGDDGDTYEALVGAANRAIFTAKDMGRNKVVVAGVETR
jgi:diguanylate cyclase (GGDEF)-like protein